MIATQIVHKLHQLTGDYKRQFDSGKGPWWNLAILPIYYIGTIIHLIFRDWDKALLSFVISTLVLALMMTFVPPMRAQFRPTVNRIRYMRGTRVRVAIPGDLMEYPSTKGIAYLRERTTAPHIETGDIFSTLPDHPGHYHLATLWFANTAAAVEFRLTNSDDELIVVSE